MSHSNTNFFVKGSLKFPRIARVHEQKLETDTRLFGGEIRRFKITSAVGDADETPEVDCVSWAPAQTDSRAVSQKRAESVVASILEAFGMERIAFFEYHIAEHTDPIYLHDLQTLFEMRSHGKIDEIGLCDEDDAHLEMLLDTGFDLAVNHVSCSVLDCHVRTGRLGELCSTRGVALIARDILLGGFISEQWLGQPEPLVNASDSRQGYLSLIASAGGWDVFQSILTAMSSIAKKHQAPIEQIATRLVLDSPFVSAVAFNASSTTELAAIDRTASGVRAFALDEEDKTRIAEAQDSLNVIPWKKLLQIEAMVNGRVSGHQQDVLSEARSVESAIAKGFRVEFSSGSKWEPICGYCRALRTGNTIRISGTTATSPLPSLVALGGASPRSQIVAIFDIIEQALKGLGSSLADLVRTRIMIRDRKYCDEVSEAHGAIFREVGVLPSNTLIVAGLIEDEFLVEVESEAEVGSGAIGVFRCGVSG